MSSTENKLEDISNAVIEVLTASCAECGVTSDIIDRQSFACSSESPTSVIHCARLEGTSEIDSASLISLIEEWVSDSPSVTLTGVRMGVDSECSVVISSLSEGECSPTQPPKNNGAIIGGVVAVILIISVALTVIAVAFIMKIRCGNVFTNNNEM